MNTLDEDNDIIDLAKSKITAEELALKPITLEDEIVSKNDAKIKKAADELSDELIRQAKEQASRNRELQNIMALSTIGDIKIALLDAMRDNGISEKLVYGLMNAEEMKTSDFKNLVQSAEAIIKIEDRILAENNKKKEEDNSIGNRRFVMRFKSGDSSVEMGVEDDK